MTPLTAATRILHRIRRELADLRDAHEVVWEHLGRIDPDPDPHLHWEPGAFGWRLHGTLVPPDRAGTERPA